MQSFGLPGSPLYDTWVFPGNSVAVGVSWISWTKPQGKSMISIFLLGAGGSGGTGVIGGANSAGGGGGQGGGQTYLEMPLALLPNQLFISVAIGAASAGFASYVSIMPNNTANHVVAIANGGAAGGNGSGITGGAGGSSSNAATNVTMPFGWPFAKVSLTGQVGQTGGSNSAGAPVAIPTTGQRSSGGSGGAGVPNTGAVGLAGGDFVVPAAPSFFPPHLGGLGTSSTTTPPGPGANGYRISPAGVYFYGGTGGGTTHGSATGAGLVQARGGDGGVGSGGGGMGAALTGSTAAVVSKGGDGLCIITCW